VYKAKITSKGQITLPAEVREALGVQPGDRVAFLPEADGEFRIRRAGSILDLAGCVSYSGPPVTIEEMNQAIGAYVSALDEATMSPAGRRRARRPKKRAA
jgi:AbrB family looped-hinge helix DNA binding protein